MSSRAERNLLIESNLPLVGYLAAETHSRATHIPRDELAAVGALALVTAAECCFSTPRITMHKCLASITTPTPSGDSFS